MHSGRAYVSIMRGDSAYKGEQAGMAEMFRNKGTILNQIVGSIVVFATVVVGG